MPRSPNRTTAQVVGGFLRVPMSSDVCAVGSSGWYAFLNADTTSTFYFVSNLGTFTARREMRKGEWYWYAYRRRGRLHKSYIGTTLHLTLDRLNEVARQLAEKAGI